MLQEMKYRIVWNFHPGFENSFSNNLEHTHLAFVSFKNFKALLVS